MLVLWLVACDLFGPGNPEEPDGVPPADTAPIDPIAVPRDTGDRTNGGDPTEPLADLDGSWIGSCTFSSGYYGPPLTADVTLDLLEVGTGTVVGTGSLSLGDDGTQTTPTTDSGYGTSTGRGPYSVPDVTLPMAVGGTRVGSEVDLDLLLSKGYVGVFDGGWDSRDDIITGNLSFAEANLFGPCRFDR